MTAARCLVRMIFFFKTILRTLAGKGFVYQRQDGLWQFTSAGVAALEYGHELSYSKRVCEVDATVAIKDCTTYELLVRLRDAGWSWH